MSYTTYDFHATLFNSAIAGQIDPAKIVRVVAAWGSQGDCAEWHGGFLFEISDGRFAYVSGWCDTTGWGCQDGAEITYYDTQPERDRLEKSRSIEWDEEPADLNRYVKGGYKDAARYA